ncbi:Cholinesterase [Dactylellina cionopaga]|nr:Cholinesterase [Dactylellina cionopaga]
MRPLISSFIISFALQAIVEAWPPHSSSPSVKITNGTVHGTHSSKWNQDFFLSIPYALPPVGNLRFRPPQYINKKKDIDAREYGPLCYGYGQDQWSAPLSEDCLTLNVVRPAGTHSDLPVAVWIHGGGFSSGSANNPQYNLTFLVDQSVKVGTPMIGVSMNYRLAAWGFLSSAEVAGTNNLNLGLRDQRLALHWVQENIRAFGGDPRKVTIFGESAGGFSVGAHQTAFHGRDDNLFRGVIMESGSPVYYSPSPFPDTFQKNYDDILTATGCTNKLDTLQCLRGVSTKALNKVFNTSNALAFGPVVDGEFISGFGSQALKEGRYVRVPTMIGTTSDEGATIASFGTIFDNDTDIKNFLGAITKYTSQTIDRLLKIYDSSVSIPAAGNFAHPDEGSHLWGSQYHRMAAILGDIYFVAGKRYTAKLLTSNKHPVDVWTFRFKAVPNGFEPWLGAAHYSETPFVFYNLMGLGWEYIPLFQGHTPAAADPLGGPKAAEYKKLADFMSKSWIRFIVHGDPAVGVQQNDVKWKKYGKSQNQIVFDIGPGGVSHEKDNYRSKGVDFIIDHMLEDHV